MRISEMDVDRVVGYFKDKSILITGSTGFLGKVLVEKILRVQPDVKKLFLLIRASDVESHSYADFLNPIMGKQIFQVLKEKHGLEFDNFVKEKICPLVGDVMHENFGLDTVKLREVSKDIDVIINGASTTNFSERYDVAFDTNVLGVKHTCKFAKKCTKLKMLLHVSTAYVAGEKEGLITEKTFLMGETLRVGTHLDIEIELNLIKDTKRELRASSSTEKAERKTMKELGLKRARNFGWPNTYLFTKAMGEMMMGHLRGDVPVVIIRPSIITSTIKEPLPGWIEGIRTVDTVIMGHAKQTLPSFVINLDLTLDMIPGDMVVNAMMAAMAAHSEDHQAQIIYHVTSSVRNPTPSSLVIDSMHRYFVENPPCKGRNGERVRLKKLRIFSTLARLRLYTAINHRHHHDARQQPPPARAHLCASGAESPQRHAIDLRRHPMCEMKHRSTIPPACTCSKTMPPEGKTIEHHHHPIRKTQIWGFPLRILNLMALQDETDQNAYVDTEPPPLPPPLEQPLSNTFRKEHATVVSSSLGTGGLQRGKQHPKALPSEWPPRRPRDSPETLPATGSARPSPKNGDRSHQGPDPLQIGVDRGRGRTSPWPPTSNEDPSPQPKPTTSPPSTWPGKWPTCPRRRRPPPSYAVCHQPWPPPWIRAAGGPPAAVPRGRGEPRHGGKANPSALGNPPAPARHRVARSGLAPCTRAPAQPRPGRAGTPDRVQPARLAAPPSAAASETRTWRPAAAFLGAGPSFAGGVLWRRQDGWGEGEEVSRFSKIGVVLKSPDVALTIRGGAALVGATVEEPTGGEAIKYELPLEMLRLVSIALCGVFSRRYNELNRKYRFLMHMIKLYAPFALFKGCFDDTNLERLRMVMNTDYQINNGAYSLDFDPKSIHWVDYFYGVHIPGVLKYCV
uniref:Fatty acyl-CoA reductase n=1 Tax=Triticum aestivum TaxID=4565 RepID=A0A0B4SVG1_WHEAT|nr:male sterility protein [Triticum aestivum]